MAKDYCVNSYNLKLNIKFLYTDVKKSYCAVCSDVQINVYFSFYVDI